MTKNTHLIAFPNLNPLPSPPHTTSPPLTHLHPPHAAHRSAHRTPEPSFSVISYRRPPLPLLPSTASPVPSLHLLSSHPCWTLSHLTSYFHSPLLLSKTQTSPFRLSSAGTSSTAELPFSKSLSIRMLTVRKSSPSLYLRNGYNGMEFQQMNLRVSNAINPGNLGKALENLILRKKWVWLYEWRWRGWGILT